MRLIAAIRFMWQDWKRARQIRSLRDASTLAFFLGKNDLSYRLWREMNEAIEERAVVRSLYLAAKRGLANG